VPAPSPSANFRGEILVTRMLLRATLCCCLLMPFARAADQDGPPSEEFQRRASQWLESTESSRRQAAYRSYLQLGEGAMDHYRAALEKAARAHNNRIESFAGDLSANPYAAHADVAPKLDEERERIIPLIRTDWHKEGSKIRMLREEMDALGRLHERAMRLASADITSFDAQLNGSVEALVEIARELERFESDRESSELDDEELREFILSDNLEGQLVIKQRERFLVSRSEAERLAKAEADNAAAGSWANASMRDFTSLLNLQRSWLGFGPFRMEEKLCAAARGHSEDMARLGFFSHTSPIKGKASPGQRAKLAGFQGGWSGENIFMGSASHTGAFNGWFGSDGHRFIMFASGPNRIGIGPSGRHWTMMTGRQ